MSAHTTEEYKGYTIEIHTDDDTVNDPRECDNLGTMVCFHKRYNLGDHKCGISMEDLQEKINSTDYISLPLYLYDHSGITMNTTGFHCRWDSGQVGYIIVSKEKVLKEYGWKKLSKKRISQIELYLINEVSTYDDYLTGNCHGYIVKDSNDEEVESCWGYLGDPVFCMIEAKGTVDYLVEHKAKVVEENLHDNHFGIA